ncbi:MAG: sugar phosphate isomerase/epimerase, partial [Armatimonadetes bacterium]|nr:sugar phosphate isomerase/epimerase [Armatimonadota bacterium]
MKPGMTMYSFNSYAREGLIDVKGFIEFAAEVGLPTVDLLAYYWRDERREPDEARALLDDLGIELAAYAVGNNFVQTEKRKFREQVDVVRRGIEMAHRLGAPVMRVFGGHNPDVEPDQALKLALDGLEAVVEEAADAGVVLAVENHGGTPALAEQVVWLMQQMDTPWVRACIDVGNFVTAGEEPGEAVSRVVGYAAHVHIKDYQRVGEGEQAEWHPCVPGQGDLPYLSII